MQSITIVVLLVAAALVAFVGAHPTHHHHHHHEDNGPVFYKFEYGVEDGHTGDKKSQFEHRDGKHTNGEYKLKEADGTTRVVKYTAGPHGGFNAEVHRIGHAQHPAHYGHGAHHHGNGGTSYVGVTHYGYPHH